MKKILIAILFAFALVVVPVVSKAQVYDMLATTGNATDTVNNTSTETLTKQINGSYDNVTVQVTITKISGTVAGTAILQASLDGVAYKTLCYGPAVVDSIPARTNVNVTTNSWTWPVGESKYIYYRVSITGSGTMSATVSAKIMVRKSG